MRAAPSTTIVPASPIVARPGSGGGETAAAAITADAAAALAPADPAALRRLERLARLLDGAFRVPGTRWRFGLDGLAGLVPGVGDSLTALVGLYMLLEARRAGAPGGLLARMLGNVAVDWAAGSVPVLGDLFDFAFKANKKNLELVEKHLAGRVPPA